jgi:hypothetical protein
MTLSKEEIRTIHPHIYWGFKCGQYVTFGEETYMFLGYKDKEDAVIATLYGDKKVVQLNQLSRA